MAEPDDTAPSTTTEEGAGECPHIADALAGDEMLVAKYKSVVSWNVHKMAAARNPAKRRKLSAPQCGTCDMPLARPFACLHCSFIGCWSEGHTAAHLSAGRHSFAADSKTGSVFCAECSNFIYDPRLDEIHLAAVLAAEEKQTQFQVSKKRREPFKPWVPNEKELAALEGMETVPCQGRRGLYNLGQTCFLNAVLQCLIHNPLLRNYFLGDKHNYKLCKLENCTCCEMDKLFSEIYSGCSSPYGPTTLLSTLWRTVPQDLTGYAQQDAHECFIATLNQIHSTSRGSTNVSCNCIIHSTFAGSLQSDVRCDKCGNVNNTIDPMLDISLELKGKNGTGTDLPTGELTLPACLRRFTQAEKVQNYTCPKCNKSSGASRRLSIRKLPPVLSFQFKRFEHKGNDKSPARKIDTSIKFPVSLNMAPYTTLSMKDMEKPSSGANGDKANGEFHGVLCGPEGMYEYDLFAVINHEGRLDNGHYTNLARYQNEWYQFDDEKVTHKAMSECFNNTTISSTAYMCFYVKRHLDYKPYIRPSYVAAAKEQEAKEKEMKDREARDGGTGGKEGKDGKDGGKGDRDRDREKSKDGGGSSSHSSSGSSTNGFGHSTKDSRSSTRSVSSSGSSPHFQPRKLKEKESSVPKESSKETKERESREVREKDREKVREMKESKEREAKAAREREAREAREREKQEKELEDDLLATVF